jgi:D-alanyl-D-alanine carboxypeptidase
VTVRRPRAFALAALLVAAGPTVPAAAQPPVAPHPVRARIDSLAEAFLRDGPAAGLTLAVVRGHDTLALRGYGEADLASHRPAAPGTVYRIGSMTKQFTAAAVLRLVEQGRLSLADTLGAYLPRYRRWRAVTIRQLLAHTSGIPVFNLSRAWARRRAESLPIDTVLGLVARDSLRFAPGTRFEYDNTGYLVLGRVAEVVTGVPFPEHLRRELFEPLAMSSARYCPDVPTGPDEARGYEPNPEGLAPGDDSNVASFGAAGALCMSVPDFLRWQEALGEGRVVAPESYRRMVGPDTLAGGTPSPFGWGLQRRLVAGHVVVSHRGDIDGFSGEQLWLPDDSVRVVVFTNTLGSRPTLLAEKLARVALGLPPGATPPAVSDSLRAAAPGRYLIAVPGGRAIALRLWTAGDQLLGRFADDQSFTLVERPAGTLVNARDPTIRLRLVTEQGRAVRVELRTAHGAGTAERAR